MNFDGTAGSWLSSLPKFGEDSDSSIPVDGSSVDGSLVDGSSVDGSSVAGSGSSIEPSTDTILFSFPAYFAKD